MGRLDGKVAIVTGAATGLGAATAELYAEEGARVIVADIRPGEAEETVGRIVAAGGDAAFVQADVSREPDVQALVAEAEGRFGQLHVMTANAGILGSASGKSIVDVAPEEFMAVIGVNLLGVFLCFKHAIPAIRRAGGGAMTATTSTSGHRGLRNFDAYAASKGGVLSLVRSVSAAVAPEIRVNAVSPGSMLTELSRHTAEDKGVEPPPTEQTWSDPGWPRGQPREVAYAHLFLVSDEASFITGQTLIADGGKTSVIRHPLDRD